MRKRRITDIYNDLDAAESSKDDDDDGKIRNQDVQDQKPCSNGKIDHVKKPERRSYGTSSVLRQPCGKYSAEFKDPFKRAKNPLGLFDTKEEADLACRRKELEVFGRTMQAAASEVLTPDNADKVLLKDIKPVQSVDDPFELFSPSSSVKSQLNRKSRVVDGVKDQAAIVSSVEGALQENTDAAEGVEDDDLEERLLVSSLLEEPVLSPSALKLMQDADELDHETDK